MFSFRSKYRNYLFDNNNLYSILTSFLVFFKKMCFFFNFFAEVNGTYMYNFNFFAEVNGTYMYDFDCLCFTRIRCGSA